MSSSEMALERTPEPLQCDPVWHPPGTGLALRGNPEWFGLEGTFKAIRAIKSHLYWIFNNSIIMKMGLLLRECWAQVQESTGWGWIVIPSLPWLCAGNRKLSPSWFFLLFVPLPIALCMWQHYIHSLRVPVPSILMLR